MCLHTCAEALGYKSLKLLLLFADWHTPSFWPENLRSNDVGSSNLSLSKQITLTNFLRFMPCCCHWMSLYCSLVNISDIAGL